MSGVSMALHAQKYWSATGVIRLTNCNGSDALDTQEFHPLAGRMLVGVTNFRD